MALRRVSTPVYLLKFSAVDRLRRFIKFADKSWDYEGLIRLEVWSLPALNNLFGNASAAMFCLDLTTNWRFFGVPVADVDFDQTSEVKKAKDQ